MAHSVGCARRFPEPEVTPIKAANPAELQQYLLSRKPDVAQFRSRGPFAVIERRDLEIPLASGLTVEADLYLCAAARKAPLVIVLHGLDNSKEDHAFQAMHLASWGMHGMALDLPKRGPWIANGETLARLVDTIYRTPQLVDDRIHVDKIILVGHITFAEIVGQENVIAGTDCGLGGRVHPQIAWAKLRALRDGATIASKKLWS